MGKSKPKPKHRKTGPGFFEFLEDKNHKTFQIYTGVEGMRLMEEALKGAFGLYKKELKELKEKFEMLNIEYPMSLLELEDDGHDELVLDLGNKILDEYKNKNKWTN